MLSLAGSLILEYLHTYSIHMGFFEVFCYDVQCRLLAEVRIQNTIPLISSISSYPRRDRSLAELPHFVFPAKSSVYPASMPYLNAIGAPVPDSGSRVSLKVLILYAV